MSSTDRLGGGETSSSSAPVTPLPSAIAHGTSHINPFFETMLSSLSPIIQDGEKRNPTFKDLSERKKQLEQENFQLRVRVFLAEQKTGVKTSGADLAAFFQQNIHHLQNAVAAQNLNLHSTATTSSLASSTSSSSNNELVHSTCKSENEQLNARVIELEQKIAKCESTLKAKENENEQLAATNKTLNERLQDLETELGIAKARMQQQQLLIASTNSVDLERGAEIAFGVDAYEKAHQEYREEVEKLEMKLMEEVKKSRQFEDAMHRYASKYKDVLGPMRRHTIKLEEYMKRLEEDNKRSEEDKKRLEKDKKRLEEDKKRLEDKVVECSKVFVDFGKKNLELATSLEHMRTERMNQTYGMDNASFGSAQDTYGSLRKMVPKLHEGIQEIITFVEALFKMDARKVFIIPGLRENHQKFMRSVQHYKSLNDTMSGLFQLADDSLLAEKRVRFVGDRSLYDSHISYRDRGDLDGVKKSEAEVQCELLSQSSEDKALIALLKMELQRSEAKRSDLLAEHHNLQSQIESLRTEFHVASAKVQDLEHLNRNVSSQSMMALEMENKTLNDRLAIADQTLRKLHQEHARLVAQLKGIQNANENAELDKNSYLDTSSARPSDSTSPDLGIDSGHDGAANSDDSNSSNIKVENRELRKTNRELALKLKQTKQVLHNTLEKLHSTTKQKEEVEKAICRQLHKTHTILRQAKKSVEKFTMDQENIVPS